MTADLKWPARALQRHFDVLLAGLLASLTLAFGTQHGNWGAVTVDLSAFLAAALTSCWPRWAGASLALVLAGLVFMPTGWPSLAEYAALIPILGTGVRGERRERLWMTGAYAALLAALTYKDSQGHPAWPIAIAAWAVLIGTMWVIGDLFTSYRQALQRAQAAAIQGQRIELARGLHDTVARELARASLRVQAARSRTPSHELDAAVEGIQRASTELRWMLSLLRDATQGQLVTTSAPGAPSNLVQAVNQLRAHGITVDSTVEGDFDAIPGTLLPTLHAVIGEMCANIERHADATRPCAIIVSAEERALEVVFINYLPAELPITSATPGLGLAGTQERLALVDGELITERTESQWISKVRIPL
ncbi:sensor histidine kinase [Micropruina sp.]|uniref:sensor histidine kinase n=1 Tax=Micropruina sp. TaxID=2737536 RepID=UPI0039E44293